jgi:hypothetical protein
MSAILPISWVSPHPPDCPAFEYEAHQNRSNILAARSAEILQALVTGALDTRGVALDTRQIHYRLLSELTPPNYGYFAGHYRGEDFRCLKHYTVTIPSDPRVGAPPSGVAYQMGELGKLIQAGFQALDVGPPLSNQDRLRYLITFVSRVFELFLVIHPYANGNGHVARFLVWCVLGRYGHWPRRFSVEPRPPDPPYSYLIWLYRNGTKEPLEYFFISMLVP